MSPSTSDASLRLPPSMRRPGLQKSSMPESCRRRSIRGSCSSAGADPLDGVSQRDSGVGGAFEVETGGGKRGVERCPNRIDHASRSEAIFRNDDGKSLSGEAVGANRLLGLAISREWD